MVNLSLCDVLERAKPLSYFIVSIESIRYLCLPMVFRRRSFRHEFMYYFAFSL